MTFDWVLEHIFLCGKGTSKHWTYALILKHEDHTPYNSFKNTSLRALPALHDPRDMDYAYVAYARYSGCLHRL